MIKHIVGFVLFSFIVGTSAFVYGLFYSSPDPVFVEVKDFTQWRYSTSKKKRKKRKCPPHRHPHFLDQTREAVGGPDIRIQEAAYVAESGDLRLRVSALEMPETGIDLHFYAVDEFGERFIKTESVPAPPASGALEVYRFRWLQNFQQKDKLFIIAEASPGGDGLYAPPPFSQSWAAAVSVVTAKAAER